MKQVYLAIVFYTFSIFYYQGIASNGVVGTGTVKPSMFKCKLLLIKSCTWQTHLVFGSVMNQWGAVTGAVHSDDSDEVVGGATFAPMKTIPVPVATWTTIFHMYSGIRIFGTVGLSQLLAAVLKLI